MDIILIAVFSQIFTSFVTAEYRLYDGISWSGQAVTITYSDECNDLPGEWVHRAKSVGHFEEGCLTLFNEFGCKGKYVHVYGHSLGHYSLEELLFSNMAASYQRCDTNKRGVLKLFRQSFPLVVSDAINGTGSKQYYFYNSGCNNLLKITGWQQRVSSIGTYGFCVALYSEENCFGDVRFVTERSTYRSNLGEVNFDKKVKSFSSCDLYYSNSCKVCPKSIYKGSNEYEFWMYFFSLYSQEYHKAFEQRVKQSPNGQIAWDFMFEPNEAPERPGDQYQDMFTSLIIWRMGSEQTGSMNFNAANVDLLRVMATRVLNEKKRQITRFAEDWNNHDFVIHKQLLGVWDSITGSLEYAYKKWLSQENEDCGKALIPKDQTTGLINDGVFAKYGDDPWHVAIYRIAKKDSLYVLICGGTLISPLVVISAGHCFYDERLQMAANKTSNYEVYVGKFKRNYFTVDSPDQKAHKIKELHFYPKGFNRASGHYGSDIMVIVLETPVTMNQHVVPICLDWDSTNNIAFNPPKGTIGRIVGWGEDDEKNGGSEDLLTANLPYISYNDCIGKVVHVTTDKFCGGFSQGQGARRGDSGGGYVVEKNGRYYLRGVVSTKDREGSSSFSTFTDVSQYMDWIRGFLI